MIFSMRNIAQAILILAIFITVPVVTFSLIGFCLSFEDSRVYERGYTTFAWLQDMLGYGAFQSVFLGLLFGICYLIHPRYKVSKKDWLQRHHILSVFTLAIALAFIALRVWWIGYSGLYMRDHDLFAKSFGRSAPIVFYNAAPKSGEKSELSSVDKLNVEIHGYKFNSAPHLLNSTALLAFKDIFTNRKYFMPFPVLYKLKDFDPDCCVEWNDGKDFYQVLLCLNTGEFRCYGPNIRLTCRTLESWQLAKFAFNKNLPYNLPYKKYRY